MLYAIISSLAAAFFRLLFRLEVRGAEHVPAVGPAMIVANHSSVFDPPLVSAAAPRPLHFMAKAELFSIPLFGRLIRAVNARPVRREGGDARALREALRILESGQALLVFPEGTRGPEGMLREGRAGAGMLAILSGAPVVPVFHLGSEKVLPRGARWFRRVPLRVRFGPPLRFGAGGAGGARDRADRESAEAFGRQLMEAIAALRPTAEQPVSISR